MDLKSQKRISSRILKCGMSRVWLDPSRISDIANAITSQDIKKLIGEGVIKAEKKKGVSSYRKKKNMEQKRKGRRKGIGRRKGKIGTRKPGKKSWISKIRALRKMLKELRDSGQIEKAGYRKLYKQASGGFFHSRAHLKIYLERSGVIKDEKKN
ncbi:MAG: 50S ribosomal protein L19e [Candidatus Aenigmarchaeota archaeon]|nr:50S ribosomal protein L19e [Candidatus Aenigmarchaeota archaeon]